MAMKLYTHEHRFEEEDPTSPEAMAAMRRWASLWPEIVARAWSDDAFRDTLLSGDRNTVTNLILDTYNYKLPDTLHLMIVEVAEDAVDDKGGNFVQYSKWAAVREENTITVTKQPELDHAPWIYWGPNGELKLDTTPLGRNTLIMPLPPKPSEVDAAVAVTAYAHAGRSYPFTCW